MSGWDGLAVVWTDLDGEDHPGVIQDVYEPITGEKRVVLATDEVEVDTATDRVEVLA